MEVESDKPGLRERIRAKIKALPPESRSAASEAICERLKQQPIWKSAQSILFFAPMWDEPNIWPLLSEAIALGKTVALPRFLPRTKTYIACRVLNAETDLETGKFGIHEPNARCGEWPLNQLDFVLVPGVAFGLNGRRLGRGRGFYDRLLAEVRGVTCGVAFEQQIVDHVPSAPHDVVLNCILTPSRWVEPKQRAVL